MNAQTILSHGIQYVRNGDTTFSHTGLQDFKDTDPEIVKTEPKIPNPRPRSRASLNNSIT